MFVHLDPRREGVQVPKWFMGQPQLVLQVGLNMAIPIPDLHVDEEGISCTLSFNRAPFWCRIPWGAIYALVGEDGRGGVWADDVPPEIQLQKQSPAAKAPPSKKPRTKLAAVDSATPAPAVVEPETTAAPAPKRGKSRDEAKPESKEPKKLAAVPPRAARAPVPVPAAASTEDEAEDKPATPSRGAPSTGGGKKPKREIPPYLRVIK